MNETFDADYFLRGPETGKSNYRDYRFLPELTVPACRKVAEYLGMNGEDSIIDIGCARGFYVRGWRELGYRAFGYDISKWAIENCDPKVREWVSNEFPKRAFDWANLKDFAEHVPFQELSKLVESLNDKITKGMLFIVPLSARTGDPYVRAEDELDSTHLNRWTLTDWAEFLEVNAPDFNVNASYNIHGIKSASSQVRHSCGFFTLIRP